MNTKNALIMAIITLLLVMQLFDGESTITAVAASDPSDIQHVVEEGEDVLENTVLASHATPARRAAPAPRAPSQTFADEEPATFEDPQISEYRAPSDAVDPSDLQSGLSPEDTEDEPFDPRISR